MPIMKNELRKALLCEVLGEASLKSAGLFMFNVERKMKINVMRKLETQTKEKLLQYYNDKNIAVPSTWRTKLKGKLLGLLLPFIPWKLILQNMVAETDHYLKIFRELEIQAAESDRPLFKYITAHELAIRRFAELELEEDSANSTNAMQKLLKSQ